MSVQPMKWGGDERQGLILMDPDSLVSICVEGEMPRWEATLLKIVPTEHGKVVFTVERGSQSLSVEVPHGHLPAGLKQDVRRLKRGAHA